MDFKEGKDKFIQAWGNLGSSWGVSRTMAQIHALLLISAEPLSTDDIMKELEISRGNANMNLRALMDWGIVFKVSKAGERMEYFVSEKDIMQIATQVAKERRKRELEPVLKMLNQVKEIKPGKSKEANEFKKVTSELNDFATKADNMLDTFIKAEEHWFFGKLFKFIK
ncbi:MAG: transcriptional regulator [Bacteroidota bacterium]|nr:transcriptional regulator [Bacteroidota bacterium]